jgi:hypothetical protein
VGMAETKSTFIGIFGSVFIEISDLYKSLNGLSRYVRYYVDKSISKLQMDIELKEEY